MQEAVASRSAEVIKLKLRMSMKVLSGIVVLSVVLVAVKCFGNLAEDNELELKLVHIVSGGNSKTVDSNSIAFPTGFPAWRENTNYQLPQRSS
jgi:hypothetical protein